MKTVSPSEEKEKTIKFQFHSFSKILISSILEFQILATVNKKGLVFST
jgi:hypothetical protein